MAERSRRTEISADWVLKKLWVGAHDELDPRQAQAMASLAGALVRVITAGEMEERLRRLEGRVNG